MSRNLAPAPAGTIHVHGLTAGAPRSAGGNALLWLDDSDSAWIVVSGGVNLFAIAVHDGQAQGAREFLFRVEAGGLFFGLGRDVRATPDAHRGITLLAAGDLDTVVAPVTRAHVSTALQDDSATIAPMVAAYAKRAAGVHPRPALPCEHDLLASGATPDAFWLALDGLNDALLRDAVQRVRGTEAAQRERMAWRRRADAAVEADAVGLMSGLLSPGGTTPAGGTGVPLHDAMQHIARAVGVSFRFPATSQDDADPAGRARRIARSSAVGCRPVRL